MAPQQGTGNRDIVKVVYIKAGDATEAQLGGDSDYGVFDRIAGAIETKFDVRWLHQADGLDQRYWDFELEGVTLMLHFEHYLGISLFPARGFERNLVANQIVRRIGQYLEANEV